MKSNSVVGQLLTVREVARILHIHENTVRRWSDKGMIKTYRIGNRGDRRFMQNDIVHFLSRLNKESDNTKNRDSNRHF